MKKLILIMISIAITLSFFACSSDPGDPQKNGPYNVSFNSMGGLSVELQVVNANSKLDKPDDPYSADKPEFYFEGWYKNDLYSEQDKWEFDNDTVNSDLTLYGHWISATAGLVYTYVLDEPSYYSVASEESDDIHGEVYIPGYHSDSAEGGGHGILKVTEIPDYGFYTKGNMTAVYLPETITTIGEGLFTYCTSLTVVALSDYIQNIPMSAFIGCTSLKNIRMPQSAESIGINAFQNTGLLSIDILSKIAYIDTAAFKNCNHLTTVNVYRSTPPLLGTDVFSNCPLAKIRVPTEKVLSYKDSWGDYANFIVGW